MLMDVMRTEMQYKKIKLFENWSESCCIKGKKHNIYEKQELAFVWYIVQLL